MRPVNKGKWPEANGLKQIFNDYQTARTELIKRLGEYCSYCEMELDSSLAVEHILPKNPDGGTNEIESRKTDWDNFLLACANCNSTKGHQEITIEDYYWPHLDNTFRAFQYKEGGIVEPTNEVDRSKAIKSIELTGLDKIPGHDPKAADRRWINRREAWDMAKDSLKDLNKNDSPEMRNQIVKTASAKGYWSIWMTVFAHDRDMRLRFISHFAGTSDLCFDADGLAIPRAGGKC